MGLRAYPNTSPSQSRSCARLPPVGLGLVVPEGMTVGVILRFSTTIIARLAACYGVKYHQFSSLAPRIATSLTLCYGTWCLEMKVNGRLSTQYLSE
jgi:hypothetical protein